MFDKGYKLRKSQDYVNAEPWFISVLYEYSKNGTDYASFIGAIDQLSLFIYPSGEIQDKKRALTFYEMYSSVDTNASLGYAYSLINGVFEKPNYKEAIRQLSKAPYERQLFLLAYLYHKGFGLEKNDTKAAYFLSHPLLESDEQAIELYKSIGVNIELDEEKIVEKINEIFDELFNNTDLKLNLAEDKNREDVNREFFRNQLFVPALDTSTNEPEKASGKESDYSYQKRNLEAIYSAASHAPFFKSNVKYCVGQFTGLTPYIAYEDVMGDRFIIRATDDYNNKSETNPVIVEYGSIEELVKDGWRLD